jgi:hypothetical protein
MELVQAAQLSRLAVLCVALAGLASGCESLKPEVADKKESPPPTKPICQVAAMWSNQVVTAPDPVHAGNPTPGLAGRVYLYDNPKGSPVSGEGTMVIDLYDMTKAAAGGAQTPLEEWRIDKDTLSRLENKDDLMGWGYTVFLPWSTYRPDLNMVQLRVRFEQVKGLPIYADAAKITLNNDMPASTTATRTITPAAPVGPAPPVLPPAGPIMTTVTPGPRGAPAGPTGPAAPESPSLPPLPPAAN